MTAKTNDQERRDFEAWISTQSVVTKYGAKLYLSSCGNHYKDLRVNQRWHAFKAGRAALQSQDREGDTLQPAANWLLITIVECKVSDIQRGLRIGYNRAQRLFDHARRIEGEGKDANI